MPDINVAYLELRLSGGSGNTDPNASLGGDASSERVLSQTATGITNITGVVVDYAGGNNTGAGTLTYNNTAKTLTWQPYGMNAGAAVTLANTPTARYAVFGEEGVLMVTVTWASLPGTNQSDTVTIANIANEVWDNVSKAESFSGDTEYRCYYVKNVHDVDAFLAVSAYIASQPSPGTIAIGVDPAGPGDGITRALSTANPPYGITRSGGTATVTTAAPHGYTTGQLVRISGADQSEYNGLKTITVTGATTFTYTVTGTPNTPATTSSTLTCGRGVAVTVGNESTAPSGVTFSSPSTSGTALNLGALAIGEVAALWTRRTIPVKNTTSNSETVSKMAFPVYF